MIIFTIDEIIICAIHVGIKVYSCLSFLCSVAFSSISINFECGFYSIIISSLRYRFNYWFILFHFPISEQESILAPLLVYGIQTLNSN